jgi:hypothetical protein
MPEEEGPEYMFADEVLEVRGFFDGDPGDPYDDWEEWD